MNESHLKLLPGGKTPDPDPSPIPAANPFRTLCYSALHAREEFCVSLRDQEVRQQTLVLTKPQAKILGLAMQQAFAPDRTCVSVQFLTGEGDDETQEVLIPVTDYSQPPILAAVESFYETYGKKTEILSVNLLMGLDYEGGPDEDD